VANPDDEKTTINVKGVSTSAWERAKKSAGKQEQPMGAWLSHAANLLADREDGPRALVPVEAAESLPAHPPGSAVPAPARLTVDELGVMMQGMAALATATGVMPAKADIRRAYAAADDRIRQDRGLPPRPVRRGKAAGKALPIERQSGMKLLAMDGA
jgi:hypothetical protein